MLRLGLYCALLAAGLQAGQPTSGLVVDSSGAPLAGATVLAQPVADGGAPDGPPVEAATGPDGRFAVAVAGTGAVRLDVSAPGLGTASREAARGEADLRIVLAPAPFFEAVNVTSSRAESPRADPTATVTVLSADELASRAAVTLDDALKLVPGFTLFRRSSSRVSNPTAQGVTLRGLGGTGSSRSLVLADGLPLNDAFGGWVYWDTVPQAAVDRVEVLRGSGSDLYGADAVGGVVQILTRHPERTSVNALAEGGTLGSGRVSLFAGGRPRGWSYTAAGEWFTTDGFVIVAEDQRGPVDTKAASAHRSAVASAGRRFAGGWRVDAGANVFAEDRRNGTPVVTNATAARRGWADAAGGALGGLLSARVYGGTQGYDQSFSAVSVDRTTEDLNRLQRIPTRVAGLGAQWARPVGRHTLLAGADGRFIKGKTQETRIALGRVLGVTDDGGTQHVGSMFVQDTVTAGDRFTLVAGAHGDGWHTRSNNTGYDKTLGSLSPRASMSWRLTDGRAGSVTVRASGYGGFRAPTLNELYRGFRTGNTQINPNESLKPERLRGADWGVLVQRGPLSARATAFWNVLDDVIANVTLSRTPTLITQQRQNADRVRSAGIELEASARLGAFVNVALSGAVVNARFVGDTAVRDHRVPQVPQSNAGLDVRYQRAGWTASGQLRVTGAQYEDDLNLLPLRPATIADLMASRTLAGGVHAFAAVENLFNRTYDVGRTPILTVGLPRAVRAGVRVDWR